MDQLKVSLRKASRYVLSLHPRTHNILIPKLMGKKPIREIVEESVRKGQYNIRHLKKLITFY